MNTAQCVVLGHEGDTDFTAGKDAPYKSCWWIFGTSFFASVVIWWYMENWRLDEYKKDRTIETKDHKDKWKVRSVFLMVLLFNVISTLMSIIIFIISLIVVICSQHPLITMIYPIIVHFLVVVIFFINGLVNQCHTNSSLRCLVCVETYKKCNCTIPEKCYRIGGNYMLPCIYQIVHHLLWVMCGGISADPSWAIPIFLCECLAMLASMYAIYLYQQASPDKGYEVVIFHLCVCVLSFWFVIATIVMSFYGHGVMEPTTGVIEIIATALFVWMVKRSGLDKLLMNSNNQNHNANNGANNGAGEPMLMMETAT